MFCSTLFIYSLYSSLHPFLIRTYTDPDTSCSNKHDGIYWYLLPFILHEILDVQPTCRQVYTFEFAHGLTTGAPFDCVHSEDAKPEEEQDCCGVEVHRGGFCVKAEQKVSTLSPLPHDLYVVIQWPVLLLIFMVSWRT